MCFTTVHHYFGYFSGLSKKLQGSSIDIIQAYDLVENVKELVDQARNDESIYDKVFDRATQMGNSANLPSLQPPRQCSCQTQRSNVPSTCPKAYFKRALYLPFVDAMVTQILGPFASSQEPPSLTEESVDTILSYYRPDLPSPTTFHQELALWQQLWNR
ncbi:hypothetical protein MAR_000690 [Mya arenaria]|uniref:Uncharacterized protein n=1 Tax=Mya arenaria TaxID=6604 RepID=A0ABY7FCV5_MYAAR|nr:hypothetical protein MAR_000690 [Mya arenaria]